MNPIKSVITLASLSLLSACATTNISSFKDADFKNSQYGSFVAYASVDDLGQRKVIENHLCKLLVERDASCQVGIELFPPTRGYSDAQIKAGAKNSGADALLTVDLMSAYTKESTVVHTTPQNSSDTYGNPGVTNTSISKSYTAVGKHKVTLIDTAQSKSAFVATTETESQWVNPAYSLAEKIVQQLDDSGLIKRKTAKVKN